MISKRTLLNFFLRTGSVINLLIVGRKNRKSISFFPEFPGNDYVLRKIAVFSGVKIRAFSPFDDSIIIAFEDSTFSQINISEYLLKSSSELNLDKKFADRKILNKKCTDISKKKVGEVFKKIFEYDLVIDPKRYNGKVVVKSNINAAHYGKIFSAPLNEKEISNDYIYMKLIDNRVNKYYVEDLRTVVVGNQLPLVYKKIRKLDFRFENKNEKILIAKTESVFSENEKSNILKFSYEMGLDIGELDILRDRNDKKIYIVDVNKTAVGPHQNIKPVHCLRSIILYHKAFKNEFLT